ncbi:hypothetical protein GOV14_05125 [Candidatus Pacearchaeota archaeon]|nr:hypothetical protein [Candidatus Pacearchaeota archaeon]
MVYHPQPYIIDHVKTINKEVKLFRIKSDLNPKPGQFFEISMPGIGECPLASCSHNPHQIDMLTRLAGNVTTAFFQLKKGDIVHIRGPYGKGFPLGKLKNKNLILIAGGTGLAPITSLINYIEQNRSHFGNIIIYFGFRNPEYILLKDKIKEWRKKFKVTICLDKLEGDKQCKEGFVHEVMNKAPPDTAETIALMCGPEIMMKSVTQTLNKLGLTDDKIYWSMERRMECAFGNCGRCLIQDVYVCRDGPVFRYDHIKPRLENEETSNKIKTH